MYMSILTLFIAKKKLNLGNPAENPNQCNTVYSFYTYYEYIVWCINIRIDVCYYDHSSDL